MMSFGRPAEILPPVVFHSSYLRVDPEYYSGVDFLDIHLGGVIIPEELFYKCLENPQALMTHIIEATKECVDLRNEKALKKRNIIPLHYFINVGGETSREIESRGDFHDLNYLTVTSHNWIENVYAKTIYITMDEHKRLLRESRLDLNRAIEEVIGNTVGKAVGKAVKGIKVEPVEVIKKEVIDPATITLDEIKHMRIDLQSRLEELERIEQEIIARKKQTLKRESQTTNGFVYVLKQIGGIHYKIGRTKNPKNRLDTFSVKLPFAVEFEILLKTDDQYTLEYKLHDHFAAKRVDGEWFTLSPEDLETIRNWEV